MRSRRHTSKPSMSGRPRSSVTRSGWCSCTRASPARPDAAPRTSSPRCSSTVEMSNRMSSSSSMTTARPVLLCGIGLSSPALRALACRDSRLILIVVGAARQRVSATLSSRDTPQGSPQVWVARYPRVICVKPSDGPRCPHPGDNSVDGSSARLSHRLWTRRWRTVDNAPQQGDKQVAPVGAVWTTKRRPQRALLLPTLPPPSLHRSPRALTCTDAGCPHRPHDL